jgi:hypothetical protein
MTIKAIETSPLTYNDIGEVIFDVRLLTSYKKIKKVILSYHSSCMINYIISSYYKQNSNSLNKKQKNTKSLLRHLINLNDNARACVPVCVSVRVKELTNIKTNPVRMKLT